MRRVELSELEKGDLILVRWLDASEIRCSVDEHQGSPEVYCKDWGAVRRPLELVDELVLGMPRGEALEAIGEIGSLGRRVRLRRFREDEIERFKVV